MDHPLVIILIASVLAIGLFVLAQVWVGLCLHYEDELEASESEKESVYRA